MKTLKRTDHDILLKKTQCIISYSKNIRASDEHQHVPSERLCQLCGLAPFVLHTVLEITRADVRLEANIAIHYLPVSSCILGVF